MQKKCISKDWYLKTSAFGEQKIDLPYDHAVVQPRDPKAPGGAANGFFVGGPADYTKILSVDGRKVHRILDIDGAYMCTQVFVNEGAVALHPHGYAPFLVDLTERLFPGDNKICLRTDDKQPSTRWYSGAGVYRDVFLWEGGEVRIEPWDTFITTPDEHTVRVKYELSADRSAEAAVTAAVRDHEGNTVATATGAADVIKGEKTPLTLTLRLDNPHLWDLDDPYLYRLHTEISVGGEVTDTADHTFGVRLISYTAEKGFQLNGKTVKMRGGCIHHDHGALGARAFPAAEERKVRLLKELGFNALRSSHYPPSLALLEACNRLGVIVMDEAFDVWNMGKMDNDYHNWFADWCDRDISYMVKRDRNHPCVMSYSTGNEIGERMGLGDGARWQQHLADEIRKYDTTRPVTNAVCGMWMISHGHEDEETRKTFMKQFPVNDFWNEPDAWEKVTEKFMEPLDIVGYNYMCHCYDRDRELYPNRVVWGSETQVLHFYESWNGVLRNSNVIGDFTWTAIDNLGEAGCGRSVWARDGHIDGINTADYPYRTCFQGDLDLCGFRRPQAYYREAIWIGGKEPHIFTTHPEHYGEGFSGTEWHWYDVLDTWTFDDRYLGKPVRCEVYTDAEEIHFFLNDRPVGTAKPEQAIAAVDVPYEKGTLTAVAFKGGKECGRFSLHTVKPASEIEIKPEQTTFKADNRDLAYFDITVRNEDGDRIVDAENEMSCHVEGGELLGFFSGAPCNEDDYPSFVCHAFLGRALAVVRADRPGEVRVTVESKELKSASATVQAE